MILDVVMVMIVAALTAVIITAVRDRFSQDEYQLVMLSFAAHLVSMVAQQWITLVYYEGGGDMVAYMVYSKPLADAIMYDPAQFVPMTVQLFFQQDVVFPFFVLGTGASTGSMVAVSAFLQVLFGASLAGMSMIFTSWAFFGKVLLYLEFRNWFRPEYRRRVQVAILLIPSVVFWSSALMKEAVAIGGIGLLVAGVARIMRGRVLVGAVAVAVGAVSIGLFKPYILFPFVVAAGLWFLTNRAKKRNRTLSVRPIYVILGAVVAVGGVALLGSFFPRYSIENFTDEAARLRDVGAHTGGGSAFELASPEKRTPTDQLLLAPWALITALFRPFVLEVRNPLMAINAIETLLLFIFSIRAVLGRSWRATVHMIRENPILIFCVAFVLCMGVAVGLASSNLGTLSRYRMPLVPFFATVLLVLTTKLSQPVVVAPRRDLAMDSVPAD